MYFYNLLTLVVIVPLTVTLVEIIMTLCTFPNHCTNQTSQVLANSIPKSPADHRDYRAIELANHIKVILVSDPQTEKSAAAMDIMAGSLNDPDDLLGLAHYLEHFLFIGTDQFSGDDALDKYLAEHGGSYNAHTYNSNSWYHFECAPDALEGALERFANLFVKPLFSDNLREGIANAVNSEYEGFLPDDAWRLRRVTSSKSKSSHPYSRFKPGNKLTLWTRPMELSIDVRMELIKFYEAHYSANLMNLALIGKESLDELQLMVESYFLDIQDRQTAISSWPESPLGPEELQTRVDIVPIMDLRHLYMTFPVPDYSSSQYKSGVVEYVVSLIKHGGPRGLLSLLKKKKWASDLSVEHNVLARGFAEITIEVTITPDGFENIDDIVLHTFQYLTMLKENGPQIWFWNELRIIKEIEFTYMEDQEVEDLVVELAVTMTRQPVDQVWTYRFIFSEFPHDLINQLLNLLNPTNFRLITQAKQNQLVATEVEEYFRVEYGYTKIKPDIIQRWFNCGLHPGLLLPLPNEFIPTEFQLKPRESNHIEYLSIPRIVLDDPMTRIWFLQDQEILQPRAYVSLEIMNHNTSQSPRNGNYQNLFVNLLNDLLTESTYSATKTGLYCVLHSMHSGISINCQGYDHKLPILFNHTLEFLINFMVSSTQNKIVNGDHVEDRFETIKEAYIRSLKNSKDEEPYFRAQHHLKFLLRSQGYSYNELLATAQDVTFDDMMDYARLILSRIRLQYIVYGNVIVDDALALHRLAMRYFEKMKCETMDAAQIAQTPLQLLLPIGSSYLYEIEEETYSQSAVLVYLQSESNGDFREERVMLMLIENMISEPCFNILRTKEQLGYVVFCSRREDSGFQIVVQGDKHVNYTDSIIQNFLQMISVTVNNLTMEDFSKYKESVSTVIRAGKPKTIHEKAHAIDHEIERATYDFDKENLDIQKLANISLEQVQNFFNTWINPASSQRKILRIFVTSKKSSSFFEQSGDDPLATTIPSITPTESLELVTDIDSWKRRLGYRPAPFTNITPWPTAS